MTTTFAPAAGPAALPGEADFTTLPAPGVLLTGVGWDLYEELLRVVGDRPIRLSYDRGDLEIMSPLPKHEKWKTIIGRMVEVLSMELDIAMEPLGSTTFRRKILAKGLEPDECYYVANEAAIRNKDEIDLKKDPPPDLAIEIDITHRSVNRERIYAGLGVPELWRFDGQRLTALRLTPRPKSVAGRKTGSKSKRVKGKRVKRQYVPMTRSLSFPFLAVADLEPFLKTAAEEGTTAAMRAFQRWVGQNLAPHFPRREQ